MATSISCSSRPGDWSAKALEFRRGWLAASRSLRHDIADQWDAVTLGRLRVLVHPALNWARAELEGRQVLLLGDAVDLQAGSVDAESVAARTVDLLAARGRKAAVRHVAYLGGRFCCFLWDGAALDVLPDCAASASVYYYQDESDDIVLSSHAHLLGEVLGSPVNERAKELLARGKELATRGIVYWPGVETPFEGVRPLLANHVLEWSGHGCDHRRFYPFGDTELAADGEAAYELFRDAFQTHVRLLCGLGRTAISLTGGRDSRASLAAALPHLQPGSLAWTFYDFQKPRPGAQTDLMLGNALARRARIPHQIVAVEAPEESEFTTAYRRTFLHTPQYRTLAHAYHDQLPHDVVELQSMVAEVGTGFFRRREGEPTPERLGRLYSYSEFGDLPEVRSLMEQFSEHADFTLDALGVVDFHDAFYWETRIGRWGALRMQEIDMSHRLVLPFNARAIVEALMGPPLEERVEKQALQRYTNERGLTIS